MALRNIFNLAVPSTDISNEPGNPQVLGVRFQVLVDGFINGVSFYKTADNLELTRDFGLWSIDVGQTGTGGHSVELATGTSIEDNVGLPKWVDMLFDSPVAVTTGVDYTVGVRFGTDLLQASYRYESSKFWDGAPKDFVNDSTTLVAPGSLGTGSLSNSEGNGLFAQPTSVIVLPQDSFNSTWYGIDVIFDDGTSDTRTLTADAGSYALGGQTSALKRNSRLASAAGSFALSGKIAALLANRRLVSDTGSFSSSGQTAALRANRRSAVDAGAFSLAGVAAILKNNRRILSVAGSYALSGVAAGLQHNRAAMPAAVGTFAYTGVDANLFKSTVIVGSLGTYGLSGKVAQLLKNTTTNYGQGSFSLSGIAANLSVIRNSFEAGSFNVSGKAVAFSYSRVASLINGNFVFTGNAATLVVFGSYVRSLSRTFKVVTENRSYTVVKETRSYLVPRN